MAETRNANQDVCANPRCRRPIEQHPGGHRRRQYCDDNCKQEAYRTRVEERRQQEVKERWEGFSLETQQYLEWILHHNSYGRQHAVGVADVIRREVEQHQWRAIEQPEPHGERPDERYQQNAQWLMECGKRLNYRALSLNVYRERFPGLFGQETDLYDIEGDRGHWEAAVCSFSPEGQLVALVHAYESEFLERLLEQERRNASEQAFHYQVQLGDAQQVRKAFAKEQAKGTKLAQALEAGQAKYEALLADFMQASKKIGKFERQVQRFEGMGILRRRESMLQELMVLGGRLKYEASTDLGIREGIDQWLDYLRGASDEDLAMGIAHGYYQADSLAMATIEASDLQATVKLRQRIDELECDVALKDARIAELESQGSSERSGPSASEAQHVADLEQENAHLKKRIEKQYERKNQKQQERIRELEGHLKAQMLDVAELEQARTDLRQLRQARVREQEEFHQLYERALGQGTQLSSAHRQIQELRSKLEQLGQLVPAEDGQEPRVRQEERERRVS